MRKVNIMDSLMLLKLILIDEVNMQLVLLNDFCWVTNFLCYQQYYVPTEKEQLHPLYPRLTPMTPLLGPRPSQELRR